MPSELVAAPAKVVVLGVPGSRRTAAILDAARRSGDVEPDVVSYPELLSRGGFVPPAGSVVRIDSPGGCPETAKRILAAGIAPMEARSRVPIREQAIAELPCGRGEILHPLQWYLGFRRVLEELDERWSPRGVRWMSSPRAVAIAFDKLACLEGWAAAGLPVPERPSSASTYAGVRESVRDRHARLFVKLRYGYSAIGAVALEWRAGLVRAVTTVEVAWSQGRPRLFVTKRPRVITREFEIAWLIDTLGMEEILVERWLPKARWRGRPFDLRLVAIGGRVRHVVGRAGTSPFTNLNLDARRVAESDVVRHLGEGWPAVRAAAERAAGFLPDACSLGLDVLVRPCRRRFAVLEANAFGDYLPGLTHEGLSTYEAEFRDLKDRQEAA